MKTTELKPWIKFFDDIHSANLISLKSTLASNQRNIEEYKRNIADYERKNVDYVARIATEEERLAKEKGASAYAEEFLSRIMRHSGVERVYIEDGWIKVDTKVLFTDIRENSGSKVMKRTCLGAFTVYMKLNSADMFAVNNLYNGIRSHWATNGSHQICIGDWRPQTDDARKKSNPYMIFDVLYHLLKSANDDGSAYTRSHEWKATRTPLSVQTFQKGDYVVGVSARDGRESMVGTAAVILTQVRHGEGFSIGFKHVGFGEGNQWGVQPSDVQKITKKQYDDSQSIGDLADLIKTRSLVISRLDKLPDGMTLAEVRTKLKI